MGFTIDAWIEYDDSAQDHPERAAEPPFSQMHDNCIPLNEFDRLRSGKDDRFFAALAGIKCREDDPDPLFPRRGGLPPNVSGFAMYGINQTIESNNPYLSWLTYPEIEQALGHMKVRTDDLSLAAKFVLDLMQSIEKRLGEGRSRLIFYIWY